MQNVFVVCEFKVTCSHLSKTVFVYHKSNADITNVTGQMKCDTFEKFSNLTVLVNQLLQMNMAVAHPATEPEQGQSLLFVKELFRVKLKAFSMGSEGSPPTCEDSADVCDELQTKSHGQETDRLVSRSEEEAERIATIKNELLEESAIVSPAKQSEEKLHDDEVGSSVIPKTSRGRPRKLKDEVLERKRTSTRRDKMRKKQVEKPKMHSRMTSVKETACGRTQRKGAETDEAEGELMNDHLPSEFPEQPKHLKYRNRSLRTHPHVCSICGYRARMFRGLLNHLKSKHKIPYKARNKNVSQVAFAASCQVNSTVKMLRFHLVKQLYHSCLGLHSVYAESCVFAERAHRKMGGSVSSRRMFLHVTTEHEDSFVSTVQVWSLSLQLPCSKASLQLSCCSQLGIIFDLGLAKSKTFTDGCLHREVHENQEKIHACTHCSKKFKCVHTNFRADQCWD